ncbi:MAG TPA: hypothetical protein VMS02_01050, partial [Solirubrobacteraceae bacterium]|nr:hypothetical protein [Solirubrobacteraceae bacterium]
MSAGRAAAALVVLLGGLAWAASAQARSGQARAPVGPPLVTSDGSEAGAVYDAAGADASSSAP